MILPLLRLGVVFAGTFMGAMWLTSKISGWDALAEKYSSDREFAGPWHKFQYGQISWAGYNGCLWVGADDDALYLRTGPGSVFSFKHPMLRIPWNNFREAAEFNVFGREYLKLKVMDPELDISLPAKTLEPYRARLPFNATLIG